MSIVAPAPSGSARSHLTLALTILLHAFTHGYGTLLVPLYVMMAGSLGTDGVGPVTLLVAVYGVVYCLLSYPAGKLADRFNRKTLLGVGLIGNAAAIALMACTGNYWLLLALAVVAGLFGTLFHPAANALAAGHYPGREGLAIGLMGIGSGLGFYAGPRYAGWRAEGAAAGWWTGMAPWQVPLIEVGLLGIVVGLAFLALARETPHEKRGPGRPMGPGMRRRILATAAVLGWRDFSGIGAFTLVSLYLQKAHGYDARHAGAILGSMMLVSIVANPIAVPLSNGRRLGTLAGLVIAGGVLLAAVPLVPLAWVLVTLAAFQVFHLGSYAVGETALLERVDPAVRGRVIGLFITCAGTVASLSPWVVGWWVDGLGDRARQADAYVLPFAALGLMMAGASLSVRIIAGLGRTEEPPVVTGAAPSVEPIG